MPLLDEAEVVEADSLGGRGLGWRRKRLDMATEQEGDCGTEGVVLEPDVDAREIVWIEVELDAPAA